MQSYSFFANVENNSLNFFLISYVFAYARNKKKEGHPPDAPLRKLKTTNKRNR